MKMIKKIASYFSDSMASHAEEHDIVDARLDALGVQIENLQSSVNGLYAAPPKARRKK